MEMSVGLVKWLSKYIDLTNDKKQILLYGLNIILSSLIGYICIIGMSCLLGVHYIVIPMLLTHSLLRCFSGGAHGSKLVYCISLSVIVFNVLGLILQYILGLHVLDIRGMLVFAFVVFMIGLYYITAKVPVDVKEKPITSEEHREKLKKYSYGILLVWYGSVFFITKFTGIRYQVVVMATTVGILWQIFTLSKLGEKFVERYGKVLTKIGI